MDDETIQAAHRAAYAFMISLQDRVDDEYHVLWGGWALREAFLAGAKWREETATRGLADASGARVQR